MGVRRVHADGRTWMVLQGGLAIRLFHVVGGGGALKAELLVRVDRGGFAFDAIFAV